MWSHLYEVLRIVRFIETGSRMVGARGWGGEKGELLDGDRVSALQGKELWGWMVVTTAQQCECA